MNIRAFEAEMTRLTIWATALELLGLVIGIWITYLVIKAAIRDGIRESGLVERQRGRAPSPQINTEPTPLPDMRADR